MPAPGAAAAGAGGMAFMFTWLRLSGNKLLDWQRCFSYQPRDITWAQQQVCRQPPFGHRGSCLLVVNALLEQHNISHDG
jgi:hypothetical protein